MQHKILIAAGVILMLLGMASYLRERFSKEATFYMNYIGLSEPRRVTINGNRPIREFPIALIQADGIMPEQVWFTDKRGRLLDSKEESGFDDCSRVWLVTVRF